MYRTGLLGQPAFLCDQAIYSPHRWKGFNTSATAMKCLMDSFFCDPDQSSKEEFCKRPLRYFF